MPDIVKSGYLRRYSRKFMNDGWKNVWVVLYTDSTLAWFKNQGDNSRKGQANMRAVSNYFAVGRYAQNVPGLPPLPAGAQLDHIIAIPEAPRRDARVEFLLASNDQELGAWMNAIASTVAAGNVQPTGGGSGLPMPSPAHHAPSAMAPPYGAAAPYPGGYPAQGYPELGFSPQMSGYPTQPGSSYPQQVPVQGYAPPYPYPSPHAVPTQPVAQSRPYPVQSGAYAYPGQGYMPTAQPLAYAGVPMAPAPHTVIVHDRGCGGSPGVALATGGTGLVGGLAAGYLMGAALSGGHHHHHAHYGGFGLGHHWGSWSSLSSAGSFGSFGSWSD